jgi:hypothetical protein
MSSTRDDWYQAIFAILAPLGQPTGSPAVGDGTFKTQSRRLQLVETFDPAGMPAIFQQQISEPMPRSEFTFGGVAFSEFTLCWYIYVYQSDESAPMTPPLNALVDKVLARLQAAMYPADGQPIVEVDGARLVVQPTAVTYWEGLLGDRAVCRIDLQAKPVSVG